MDFDEIELGIERNKDFIRNRITQLRINADVSEYQMSLELGQSRSYIQGISSGKAMPSMAGFLNICDYFHITPLEFFDNKISEPKLLNEVTDTIKHLNEEDLSLILDIANRLIK